jgi:hypothetical protein
LLIAFGRVSAGEVAAPGRAELRVSLLKKPYEFLQVFHAGNFREELIDNLLRNVRHEC